MSTMFSKKKRPHRRPPRRGVKQSRRAQSIHAQPALAQSRYRSNKAVEFNRRMFFLTLGVGVCSFLLCLIIYNSLVDRIPRTILMGIVWSMLCLPVAIAVTYLSDYDGVFDECNFRPFDFSGGLIVAIISAVLLTGIVAALFQLVYELEPPNASKPTSYIFVIDDSGSMESNDSTQERYKAIASVLSKKPDDFQYMVYGFSDSPTLITGMTTVSSGIPSLSGRASGGTAIRLALESIINDRSKGMWDGGSSPRVILLTDGETSKSDVNWLKPIEPILKRYNADNISISTVGLGHVNKSLMEKIARTTGGVFVEVSSAEYLYEALDSAAVRTASRDLLSDRVMPRISWLYGIFRVLFLTILGTLIGAVCVYLYGRDDTLLYSFMWIIAKSFTGAFLTELLICALGFPAKLVWMLLWVAIAAFVCLQTVRHRKTRV